MKTLLLIDGNAIMHRAYHALPPLTSQNGTPTNMIYGFFTMLHRVITDFRPHYLAVCFDTPKPTFRQELMKEYQAQRPHAADDFKVQIPYIMQLLDAAGISRMELDGYEADDVIGSITTKFKKEAINIYILTGDKDIMQLVDKNVSVISTQMGLTAVTLYTPEKVKDKLHVTPEQIPDYKALAGDPSDNYGGVKGIGPKNAEKLIKEYGSVENLAKHIDSIANDKLRLLLSENRDILTLTKKIATIVKDLHVEKSLDEFGFVSFKPEMKDSLQKLQLYSLIKRLFSEKSSPKVVEEKKVPKDN